MLKGKTTRDTMKKSIKGQMTVMYLIIFVVLIMVFAIMLPILRTFIGIGVNATDGMPNGGTIELILNNIPVLIGLVLIITLFVGVSIYRAQ